MPNPTSLKEKCLLLTGSFETGKRPPDCYSAVSGNFDGMGLSFGCLQWNFGQGSLQPILKDIYAKAPGIMDGIFGSANLDTMMRYTDTIDASLEFCAVMNTNASTKKFWRDKFAILGTTQVCQQAQLDAASKLFNVSLKLAASLSLKSERGVALMFDCVVQNGGVRGRNEKAFLDELRLVGIDEETRMLVISRRVVDKCKKEWAKDVASRKFCIALGEGIVHGSPYNLEGYGISLSAWKK